MAAPARISLLAAALLATMVAMAGCGDSSATTATVTSTETVAPTGSTTGSTASTTTQTTSSSTTSTIEGSAPPADIQVTEITGFTSPSGNIGCYIDRHTVRCDIAERDWQPPQAPSSCRLDYGQGISLDAGGSPGFVCAGDTALGGGDALPYGQSIASGLLRCESEESGMSCRDVETGRGFTISRQGYDLF